MTNVTSNILPLPTRHASIQTGSQPLPSESTTPCLKVTVNEGLDADEEYREHVATIVGVAIRAGRRKRRSLSSLQPQLRKWLIDLCEQGNPTAIMVRDWLTRNRQYLAPGFDHEHPHLQRTPKHGVNVGEGA
ncbi:Hypothetical protein NGAL_HAMBI2610_42060 [Neorhizobium galegae bv. orientalis]|nr:Hypothetical protein NGAL_HAMBI2610_42060 [Neorhizobium galegae bv. orientalis]